MKYKGVIFDVDGTAVPLGAMSAGKELKDAVRNNKEKIHLSAATGRSLEVARPLIESLGLTDPCVIMGGSAIVDPRSFEILWQKGMTTGQVTAIAKILRDFDAKIYICEKAGEHSQQVKILPGRPALVVYALAVEPQSAITMIEELRLIDGVAAHGTPSWDKGKVDVHVTHTEATKEHGIRRLKEMLGLKTEELVGVGDSANDIPIFASVGHKVAIGSGSQDLKKLADQIAPPVDQNGLAFIINQITSVEEPAGNS